MLIKIQIEGISPIMFNKFTDAAAEKASGGTSSSATAHDRGTPLEIAESKLYLGLDGKPMVPSPNLFSALVGGGSFHKMGKRQITTKASSALYSCCNIEAATVQLQHRQPWKVDTRPVRNPATGGRFLTHRPMFDDWRLDFELSLDTTIISAQLLRAIVDDAGKRVGLGDYRPMCKGPFGRFVVTRWVAKEDQIHQPKSALQAAE